VIHRLNIKATIHKPCLDTNKVEVCDIESNKITQLETLESKDTSITYHQIQTVLMQGICIEFYKSGL